MNSLNNEISIPEIKTKTPDTKGFMRETWFTKFFSLEMVFIIHLFVYGAVIGLCSMLNLMYWEGRLWTVTAALGWLTGLATHYTLFQLSDRAMFTKEEGLRSSLYLHLTVYISTSALLVWINLAMWQGILWFPIALFGWGIGLGVHYIIDRYYEG